MFLTQWSSSITRVPWTRHATKLVRGRSVGGCCAATRDEAKPENNPQHAGRVFLEQHLLAAALPPNIPCTAKLTTTQTGTGGCDRCDRMAPPLGLRLLAAGYVAAWFLLCVVRAGPVVTISNVKPRLDTQGNVVNAHSGNVVQFNAIWHMYGTAYQQCHQDSFICGGDCGYFHNVFVLYTSPDLGNWTLVSSNLLPALLADNANIEYDECNVAYNELTQTYVMMYWSGHFGFHNSQVAMAVSRTPEYVHSRKELS
jgi:hypothetical protein